MNLRLNIALAFALMMGLLLSEASLHTLLHDSHHTEEQHETCDGHHHETASSEDSICSHEHQCELCVLIQASTDFLPQVKSQGFATALPEAHFHRYENVVCFSPLEVSSPRAPPAV